LFVCLFVLMLDSVGSRFKLLNVKTNMYIGQSGGDMTSSSSEAAIMEEILYSTGDISMDYGA